MSRYYRQKNEQHRRRFLHRDFGQQRTMWGERSFDEHLYRQIIQPKANATNIPTTVGQIISLLSS